MVLLLERIQDFFLLRIVKNRVSAVFESYIIELDKGGFKLLQRGAELSGDRFNAVCRYIENVATSKGVFAAKDVYEFPPHPPKKKSIRR